MKNKTAVVAIGGNSLIKDKYHQTVRDQYVAAKETCHHIVTMIKDGWKVVISHGNGPQVGFMLRRSEIAKDELHQVPLEVCGANSQGAIGYALQQNLYNEFKKYGMAKTAVTVVTQVEISPEDPGLLNPTKPIGSFMDRENAERHRVLDGWNVVEDAGRGWRRVVASPLPFRIVEVDAIKSLLNNGFAVIAAGGGGIPVVVDEEGELKGIPAVIDKDHASSLLANEIGAGLFIISTAVEKVALHFGKPNQQWLDHLTVAEARQHLEEGIHFAGGSMAPKIEAAINFLEGGGEEAIITDPENLERALNGETGTRIVP